MKTIRIPLALLLAGLLLAAGMPRAAWAISLSKYSAATEDKKVVLTFKFSANADYTTVSHYKDNYVALKVKGLQLSRSQLRGSYEPKDAEQKGCFRKVSFVSGKDESEIHIALSKDRTPGDVQVTPDDSVIRVEIFLPTELVKHSKSGGTAKPADSAPAGDSTAGGSGPGPTSWPPEDGASAGGGDSGGAQPPADTGPADSGTPAATGGADAGGGAEASGGDPAGFRSGAVPEETHPADASAGGDSGAAPAGPPAASDAGAAAGPDSGHGGTSLDNGPSYKNFDLSSVPASKQEFSNLPLNEAVMRLVADAGFNVVVGKDVSDMRVTLSFTHNQLSLKRALDALCMAYDLSYTVEDSAIVIRGTPGKS